MAQTIIVDISTRGANPVAYTHQGDTGRTFFAEIYENGEAFAVAGYTIKVGAILPADRGYTVIAGNDMVTATKTNDNTTNKIYFTLSNKYSLKAGNGILTLIFTSNTGTPSTIRPINIDLRIQKSADADDTIAGASDFPEGLEAIAEEVFQEYLSTYLPPVAPSASAAANKAADAKLTGEALDDLKSDLTPVRDIFIRVTPVEEHPITRPSSEYGSPTFNGYAFPLKDIANIGKIVFRGLASASATLNVGIATTIVSDVTQISYLSIGTASVGTSKAFTEITMPTYTAKGPGYIVIYANQTISSLNNSAKYDSDIIDNSMTAYYIEGQTANPIAAENFMKWSPHIYFYRDVETVDQTMIHKMNHIYVATTGSDDNGDGTSGNPFATIYHANSIINDNSASNEYTIHVADGTYTDLQSRYSNAPQSSGYQGIVAKNHVYYIGNEVHPENVIIQWDGSTGYSSDVFNYYDYGFYKCPFHIVGIDNGGGKTAIKGMTFVCSNTRYCLHVDTSGYGKGVDWVVETCIFDWRGTPDCADKTSATATIGNGSSNDETGLVKNCLFKNVSGQTAVFTNHDCENRYGNDALKVGADITFENCKFNGGAEQSLKIRMRNLVADSNYDLFNRIQIINCIGITTFDYGVSSPATACNWRALVRCSPIETNKFAQDGLMQ